MVYAIWYVILAVAMVLVWYGGRPRGAGARLVSARVVSQPSPVAPRSRSRL